MKIALLGNSRFIGLAVAELAVRAGHEVTIIHTGKYDVSLPGASYRVASRAEPTRLRRVVEELRPDALVDTVAMTVEHARIDIEALSGVVPRVVVLSSQDVYAQFGSLLGHPCENIEDRVTEASPLTVPYPFRGIAKHRGGEDYDKKDVERAYREASGQFESVTVLRLPATYGRRDNKRRFSWIVDALDSGQRVVPRAGGQWRWTHGHIDDVARVVLSAAERAACPYAVFNVGEGEAPTMSEWAERIAGRMRLAIEWQEVDEVPAAFHTLGGMPNDFVADTSLCQATFGTTETDSDRRIDDLIAWLRESRE